MKALLGSSLAVLVQRISVEAVDWGNSMVEIQWKEVPVPIPVLIPTTFIPDDLLALAGLKFQ